MLKQLYNTSVTAHNFLNGKAIEFDTWAYYRIMEVASIISPIES